MTSSALPGVTLSPGSQELRFGRGREPLLQGKPSLTEMFLGSNHLGSRTMRKSVVVLLTLVMFVVGSSVAFAASHEEGEANSCNPCNPCNPENGDGN